MESLFQSGLAFYKRLAHGEGPLMLHIPVAQNIPLVESNIASDVGSVRNKSPLCFGLLGTVPDLLTSVVSPMTDLKRINYTSTARKKKKDRHGALAHFRKYLISITPKPTYEGYFQFNQW